MPRLVIGIDASRSFGPRPTGTERYSTEVIRRLVGLGGHRYRLYFRAPPDEAPPRGAEVRVLPARRLWTHTRLAAEVALRPPDVLFVPAHVLPFATRPKCVVTVHDLGYLAFPEAHTRFQRWYLDRTTRRHARCADHLVADSAATRDDLIRHYGADPARITVVHLGVEEAMRPAPEAAVAAVREIVGLPPGARYVLHVGTLQPRKNLPRLIEAFARVVGDEDGAADGKGAGDRRRIAGAFRPRDDVFLVLAGMPGWGDHDLARQARSLGIADRVLVPGYLARESLPALYTGALALCMPSLYEGFGLPVLEAMACGTPVACSATSSLPEVAGDAALLFDPLDVDAIAAALGRLIDDDNLRSTLAARGPARAERFTWDRCARETLAVLERVGAGR